jgi:hypothetical protein
MIATKATERQETDDADSIERAFGNGKGVGGPREELVT